MSAESIEVCGTKIVYDVTGSGSPLILMHGWGCNSDTVASLAAVASETHRVYNIDLPGHGASPEPKDVWGVEEYTMAIEELVSKLKLENPAIIGHSFGGRIGILYSSRNKVDKLILVDAAGVKPRRSMKYYYKVGTFKAIKNILNLVLGKDKAKPVIERLRAKRGSADYAAASPMMKNILSKSVNQDLRRYMPEIKSPTLLVWGEEDTATPLRDAKIMEKLIPNAGLVSFPGCGHYSFLDNPGGCAAVLRSFLNSKN